MPSSFSSVSRFLGLLGAGVLLIAAAPAPAPAPAGPTKVNITLSCLPNALAMSLADCKVMRVDPFEFTPLVSTGAIKGAEASKLPADWRTSLKADGARVLVTASVMAQPQSMASLPAAPAPSASDVVVTLSCLPNPDLSLRDCQARKVEPEAPGAAEAALAQVMRGKLDPNWRNIYKTEDGGRVLLPVRLSKSRPG